MLGKKGQWGILREHQNMYEKKGMTQAQMKRHFKSYINKFARDAKADVKRQVKKWKKANKLR